MKKLRRFSRFKTLPSDDLVALTLIDSLMKEGAGYANRISSVLGKMKTNIEMASSSLESIWVAVKSADLIKASGAIAEEFELLEN